MRAAAAPSKPCSPTSWVAKSLHAVEHGTHVTLSHAECMGGKVTARDRARLGGSTERRQRPVDAYTVCRGEQSISLFATLSSRPGGEPRVCARGAARLRGGHRRSRARGVDRAAAHAWGRRSEGGRCLQGVVAANQKTLVRHARTASLSRGFRAACSPGQRERAAPSASQNVLSMLEQKGQPLS